MRRRWGGLLLPGRLAIPLPDLTPLALAGLVGGIGPQMRGHAGGLGSAITAIGGTLLHSVDSFFISFLSNLKGRTYSGSFAKPKSREDYILFEEICQEIQTNKFFSESLTYAI